MANIFQVKKSKLKVLRGWAAYDPHGNMHGYVVRTRGFARSSAAQHFVPTHGWRMPDDWHRAEAAGWTVARVAIMPL